MVHILAFCKLDKFTQHIPSDKPIQEHEDFYPYTMQLLEKNTSPNIRNKKS